MAGASLLCHSTQQHNDAGSCKYLEWKLFGILQLSSEVTHLRDGIGQTTNTQIVVRWYDEDCPIL